MVQQRYESVDCAKGIGIMLVVFAHVIATHNVGWKIEEVITSFHMPLFFVLSGLFFGRKGSLGDFIVGKINRLLVPFFFFFLIISVVLPFTFFCIQGTALSKLPMLILGPYNENLYIVGAIWFLMSLFIVNIIFWLATIPNKHKEVWAISVSLVLGVIGFIMGKKLFDLPFWLDTSLTCMPYFCLGFLLKTKLLTVSMSDSYNILLAFLSITAIIAVAGHTCYRANHYDISIWRTFLCGVLGFFAVFFLSNTIIKRIECLRFIGKNSIIILAIHQLIMTGVASALNFFHVVGWCAAIANFTITMIACGVLIPIMLKYLPHVTGQKQFF